MSDYAGIEALQGESPARLVGAPNTYPTVDFTQPASVFKVRTPFELVGWLILQGDLAQPTGIYWLPDVVHAAAPSSGTFQRWVDDTLRSAATDGIRAGTAVATIQEALDVSAPVTTDRAALAALLSAALPAV